MKRSIALAANYAYINQLETTIKSVLMHNVNLSFYIMNSDIPQEWFEIINQKLNSIGSQVVDEKVDPALLSTEHISQPHLNPIAYAKFCVPERIQDDIVLYLDSDIIVTGSLSPLFATQFSDDELVAVAEEIEGNGEFNDGVIVYNNKKLRNVTNLISDLLEMGKNNQLINGDQTVFNDYFAGHIKQLPAKYNYEIGMDRWAFYQNRTDMIDKLSQVKDPIIVHYANDDKPWNTTSSGRMRSLWWKVYSQDWDVIINHTKQLNVSLNTIKTTPIKLRLFTLTNDQNLQHLEELVQKLPECQFNIAAYSYMGWNLGKMPQYPNVKIYPVILKYKLDELFNSTDVYLDINFGRKEVSFISKYQQTGKNILSFESTSTSEINGDNYHVFADNQVDQMVNYIHQLEK